MTTPIFGVYTMRTSVEAAIDQLSENGFMAEDITVAMPGETRDREFPHEQEIRQHEQLESAPEETAAPTSGMMNNILARLANVEHTARPGTTLAATGPLVSELAGQAVEAEVPTEGAVPESGANPDEANPEWAEYLQEGNILVGVLPADDELAETAKSIFDQTGAMQIIYGRPLR